jgi:hypothetical protein
LSRFAILNDLLKDIIMNVIKTLALVSALFAAQSAMAANYDLGLMGPPADVSKTVSSSVGVISDTFTFSIDAPANAGGSTTENGSWGGFLGLKLTGADVTSVTLYDSTASALAQFFQGAANLDLTPASFSFDNLAAGSYTLLVNGLSGKAGSYTVNLSTVATATAVPEPEAYAMILAGLGLVGFAARRKFSA